MKPFSKIVSLPFSLTLLTLALAFVFRSTAHAETDPAEEFIAKGRQFMQSQRYREALDSFARARNVTRSPLPIAQVGLAEQALARWVPAESHLREALTYEDDAFIKDHKNQLEHALTFVRQHLALLKLVATPAGAVVKINGESLTVVPLQEPLYWVPGKTKVELVVPMPGYECPTTEIELSAGETRDLKVDCKSLPPIPAVARSTPTAGANHRVPLVDAKKTADRDNDHLVAALAATGTGVFLGSGAVVLTTGLIMLHDGDHDGRLPTIAGGVGLGAAVALFFVWQAYEPAKAPSPRAHVAFTGSGLSLTF